MIGHHPGPGSKNIYLCKACGQGFVSVDRDKGTTPAMTNCLHCGGMAISLWYACPQEILRNHNPAIEWYRPDDAELACIDMQTQDHVRAGGLLSRPWGGGRAS